jgi:predicted dehydrogenase
MLLNNNHLDAEKLRLSGDSAMTQTKIGRRQFLKRATGTALGIISFPYVIAPSALGKGDSVSASNRITMGFIGMGRRTTRQGLLGAFLHDPGVQVLGLCDVDALKLKGAKDTVEKYYTNQSSKGSYKGCAGCRDFREMLGREDIDAVLISLPDHWHAIPVIEAAKAGKDIYAEKPLSFSIVEGRAMVKAVRNYERVFQTGSQQRSSRNFRFACELVRNGYIGELKTVTVGIGGPPDDYCDLPAEPEPDYIDWDMWLGPAPWRPYSSRLSVPVNSEGLVLTPIPAWRYIRDYSGGHLTDWGAHHFDIAQWGMDTECTGPVEIIPPDGKNYKVLTYKYTNGVTMTRDKANGILFSGTEGKVEVNRGYLRTWPESLSRQQIGVNEIHLYESNNHGTNWLDSIRQRRKPICDVEIGHRSVSVAHLGNIAYRLRRPLKWDPEKERFINDVEANRLLWRPMRSPWRL